MKDEEFDVCRHWLDRPLDEIPEYAPLPLGWRIAWVVCVVILLGCGVWAWVEILRWLA